MMDVVKELLQNPFLQLSSFIIGVAGLLLSVIFYRLSRRVKQPFWAITTTNLIRGFSGKLPELEIKYSGENVENLSVSKVMFWNGGSDTIEGTDIAEADPLRIIGKGNVNLLSVQLVEANSAPSRFLLSRSIDGNTAFLGFDFLDRKDGAVIQVIHTGVSSEDIRLVGTIKGGGRPIKREVLFSPAQSRILAVLLAGVIIFATSASWEYIQRGGGSPIVFASFFVLPTLVILILIWVWFIILGRSAFIPKGLESWREQL